MESRNPPARIFRRAALLLVIAAFLSIHGQVLRPAHARAHVVPGPVEVGTSFSPLRAAALGLDYQAAFLQLEAMHFRVIRLSTYWDQADLSATDQLDWMMQEANRARQPVVLAVGMKGLGWPEFFIPPAYQPVGIGDGEDVAKNVLLRDATLAFVREMVDRYRLNPALVAWQVENEPFNRAGPHRWWIGRDFLLQEVAALKQLDNRPVIVNAFGHFDMGMDAASNRNGFDLRALLGFDADSAERQSLSTLAPGDILGLDTYTDIGYQNWLGLPATSRAGSDWADVIGRWRRTAAGQGKRAWVTEMQAEPWEANRDDYLNARSTGPQDIGRRFTALHEQGFPVILLWGSEYWLYRAHMGDPSWLAAVQQLTGADAQAPAVS
ncbi:MAG: hypothetical protein E6I70_01550 [Chloroflexi bacterium]|nr:MAG: hypothetical protein E6I70_01550 [Chloroflexota bacterium]